MQVAGSLANICMQCLAAAVPALPRSSAPCQLLAHGRLGPAPGALQKSQLTAAAPASPRPCCLPIPPSLFAATYILSTAHAVLAANLLCRLPDPSVFLRRLPSLIKPGGVLVLVSPYSWLPAWTDQQRWLGGYRDEVRPPGGSSVAPALQAIWKGLSSGMGMAPGVQLQKGVRTCCQPDMFTARCGSAAGSYAMQRQPQAAQQRQRSPRATAPPPSCRRTCRCGPRRRSSPCSQVGSLERQLLLLTCLPHRPPAASLPP